MLKCLQTCELFCCNICCGGKSLRRWHLLLSLLLVLLWRRLGQPGLLLAGEGGLQLCPLCEDSVLLVSRGPAAPATAYRECAGKWPAHLDHKY